MVPKSEKRITLNIKGRDWTFRLMSDKNFDKLHNSNEKEDDNCNVAMTLPTHYEVHFRKSDWCAKDIRHEIGHLLYSMTNTHTASHDPLQTEETFCEIIADHSAEIIFWSDLIADRFFQETI